MSIVKFNYVVYRWSPPNLSPKEEIEVGEQIHRLGKARLVEKFIGGGGRGLVTATDYGLAAFGIVALICACVFLPVVIVPLLFILAVGIGSYTIARLRFGAWLRRCHAAYLSHGPTKWVQKEITSCPKCGQRMRYPGSLGRLRLTCPKCRAQFLPANPANP